MRYAYRIFESIAQAPQDDWNEICRLHGETIFMNPAFLENMEITFNAQSRFWYVIFYDEVFRPIGCTCLSTFSVDLLTLSGSLIKDLANRVRTIFPGFAKVKVILCGLPISAGQNHLIIAKTANTRDVLRLLDNILAGLAHEQATPFIIYKEFDLSATERMDSLFELGYRRAVSPAMHDFIPVFEDFDAYCAALRSHYRNDIRRSQRKFTRANLRVAHFVEPREIDGVYTAKTHRLYEAVVEKAEFKLEVLPIDFFLGLVKRFPRHVSLTVVYKEDQIVAFNWGMLDGKVYKYLFCGIDYDLNADTDLYFNLMFHQLDAALRQKPALIMVGQTADTFKARLGCKPRNLFLYLKGSGIVSAFILKYLFGLLFKNPPSIPQYAIFKSVPTGSV